MKSSITYPNETLYSFVALLGDNLHEEPDDNDEIAYSDGNRLMHPSEAIFESADVSTFIEKFDLEEVDREPARNGQISEM
jgi:hypothetical protein